jgi:hypothetical protein
MSEYDYQRMTAQEKADRDAADLVESATSRRLRYHPAPPVKSIGRLERLIERVRVECMFRVGKRKAEVARAKRRYELENGI